MFTYYSNVILSSSASDHNHIWWMASPELLFYVRISFVFVAGDNIFLSRTDDPRNLCNRYVLLTTLSKCLVFSKSFGSKRQSGVRLSILYWPIWLLDGHFPWTGSQRVQQWKKLSCIMTEQRGRHQAFLIERTNENGWRKSDGAGWALGAPFSSKGEVRTSTFYTKWCLGTDLPTIRSLEPCAFSGARWTRGCYRRARRWSTWLWGQRGLGPSKSGCTGTGHDL